MAKARTAWFRIATALMFALWLAVGCTDSNAGEQGVGGAGGDAGAGGTGGNGVEGSSIGPVLGGVNEAAEAVLAENRSLLDGLRFAASYVARTLADAPMTAVSTIGEQGGDDPPCILGAVDGMQFIYNEATGAYETSGDGTGPGGTVRFSVYEIVDDAPDTESPIGSLVLSCVRRLRGGTPDCEPTGWRRRYRSRRRRCALGPTRGARFVRHHADSGVRCELGRRSTDRFWSLGRGFDFARRRWPHGLYRIRPWVHDERDSPVR